MTDLSESTPQDSRGKRMADVDEVIKDFFLKHEYDPVKAHQYYIENRKLKGRKKGNGKPLVEDQVPESSPTGAKLLDFDPKIGAVYNDGSVLTPDGWKQISSRRLRMKQTQKKIQILKAKADKLQGAEKKNMLRKIAEVEHLLTKVTTSVRVQDRANAQRDQKTSLSREHRVSQAKKKLSGRHDPKSKKLQTKLHKTEQKLNKATKSAPGRTASKTKVSFE